MESFFLVCFAFGALFSVASLALGAVAHGAGAGPHGHAPAHPLNQGDGLAGQLPLLNGSSVVAFLTWFGGAGYLLARFAQWLLLPVLLGALAAGAIGALLIALLLRKVLAGEREMDPDDYRLEGTIGRVTISIPAGGTGEVVFSKAGARRGEAARALGRTPIPRGTEVVITGYAQGFATVQPWAEFIQSREPGSARRSAPSADAGV